MTLLDLLTKAAGAGLGLAAFLEKIVRDFPDLAPEAQELLAALNMAISTTNLVSIVSALPGEIANVVRGKLDPHDHPSDAL